MEINIQAVKDHQEAEFERVRGCNLLLIGHAVRPDLEDDDTMTGRVCRQLSAWRIQEITLLPGSHVPCRADGYAIHRYVNADYETLGECLSPRLNTLRSLLEQRRMLILGEVAQRCVEAAARMATDITDDDILKFRSSAIAHPCYWERPERFEEAYSAFASRIPNFATKEQFLAIVKVASRTPNREALPRTESGRQKTREMGRGQVDDREARRAEQQIGVDPNDIRRRLTSGQKLVQIAHEMGISTRSLVKTLSATRFKDDAILNKRALVEANDEDEDRSENVAVNFLTDARSMGYSAHDLAILNPVPVSWKDVRVALNLTGNTAREVSDGRLLEYENVDKWLTTAEIKRLVVGAGSVERVARVLLPPKSTHLREWIKFVEAVVAGTLEASDNPRLKQKYFPPAARKRRRAERSNVAQEALTNAAASSSSSSTQMQQ